MDYWTRLAYEGLYYTCGEPKYKIKEKLLKRGFDKDEVDKFVKGL